MDVTVNDATTASFWSTFKKRPVFVPLKPGVARVTMYSSGRNSRTSLTLEVGDNDVFIVEAWARLIMSWGIQPARLVVLNSSLKVCHAQVEPKFTQRD